MPITSISTLPTSASSSLAASASSASSSSTSASPASPASSASPASPAVGTSAAFAVRSERDGDHPSVGATLAPLGVYVHFPWCLSKCPYCDFVVYAAPKKAIDHVSYADAVLHEHALRAAELGPHALTSIFFGGGTPSLWDPAELARVLDGILTRWGIHSKRGPEGSSSDEKPHRPQGTVEVSLECDPSSLDYDRARALVDAGVDRLSIGVQALSDERLRFLGRIHTTQEAIASVRDAVRAKVPRISVDLMYAVADQAPEAAAEDARRLVELGATHVSAYSLTIEAGTRFGELARRGRLPLADDGRMAASFFAIDEMLTSLGFEHYEISNYALPGQRSRHNSGYWSGRDYLGLGCGAYGTVRSLTGEVRRYRNQTHPAAYLQASSEGAKALTASEEILDGPTRLRERIMLGLRTKEGLDLEAVAREVGAPPFPEGRRAALAQLAARGRVALRGSQVSVPRDAWIWVDDTAATLF